MPIELDTGQSRSVSLIVARTDTAAAMGSGDVDVLATPRVVALVEQAACAVLAGQLDPGTTSVGVRIELDHRRPTRIGATVTATAVLTGVDGRKLDFTVRVHEGEDEVASGVHRRVITSRDTFAQI
ncbi:MAG TPA: hotdog domain-containing protein [Euzebya sp.]|nr:hotdog domain-containing protein [Euzebya sp.]